MDADAPTPASRTVALTIDLGRILRPPHWSMPDGRLFRTTSHGLERFVAEVRCDDPELASYLRIEERELEAGGLN